MGATLLFLPSSIPSMTALERESLGAATDEALSSSVHAKIYVLSFSKFIMIFVFIYHCMNPLRHHSDPPPSQIHPNQVQHPHTRSQSGPQTAPCLQKISSKALPLIVEAIWHRWESGDSCMHACFAAKAEALDKMFTWNFPRCCINFDFLLLQ